MSDLNLFESFLFEAPGDDPPDTQPETEPSAPPDVPDGAENDPGPPDISGAGEESDPPDGDLPPDMGDAGDFSDDESFDDMSGDEGPAEGEENKDLGIDEKISAIMNMQLFQRFITLLSTIGSQLSSIRNNSDILYTLSEDSVEFVEALKKLDENLRLYINNSFINENYSKNLLFFNKCLNLLKLLNDVFDKNVRKGINSMK